MDWQYIAGFFDGEGSIVHAIGSTRIIPKLHIYQHSILVLEKIALFFSSKNVKWVLSSSDMSKYKAPRGSVKNKRQGTQYIFKVLNRRSVEIVLRGMLPFLIVKKPAAQDSLRFMKMYAGETRRMAIFLSHETRKRLYGPTGMKHAKWS